MSKVAMKLMRAEGALQKIATGRIAGEPHNHRDMLSIVRDIAKEALIEINPMYEDWFKSREAA